MPTVLRESGFTVVIYFDDHLPYHVHVFKAGGEAKINLDPIEIVQVKDMKKKDVRKALEMVLSHQLFLIDEWRRIHGSC